MKFDKTKKTTVQWKVWAQVKLGEFSNTYGTERVQN